MIHSLHEAGPKRLSPRASGVGSLFSGIDEAARSVLGITAIKHRSALHELGRRAEIPSGLVREIFEVISANFASDARSRPAAESRENWRWCRPQAQIASHNTSPEVRLERAIAAASVRTGRQDWANQVPVASGLMHAAADRRRAIDLVHRRSVNHFELIELKIASDTPLYAAVEILGYGCAWLLAHEICVAGANALLDAQKIDLVVLAPESYFQPYQLMELERSITVELGDLGKRLGVTLKFRFDLLPHELCATPLPDRDGDLLASLENRLPLHSA